MNEIKVSNCRKKLPNGEICNSEAVLVQYEGELQSHTLKYYIDCKNNDCLRSPFTEPHFDTPEECVEAWEKVLKTMSS